MYNLERIKKECLWDYNFIPSELENIAKNGSAYEKRSLFAKILEHSSDALNDLNIFDENDKKNLLGSFKLNHYNESYLSKKYNILRHFILGENVEIRELKWRI